MNTVHLPKHLGKGYFAPVCGSKTFTAWSNDPDEVNCLPCLTKTTGIGDLNEILSRPQSR